MCIRDRHNDTSPLTDQVADIHYSITRLLNGNRRLDVDGVADTQLVSWKGSEDAIANFEIIKFRIVVDHIYGSTEAV